MLFDYKIIPYSSVNLMGFQIAYPSLVGFSFSFFEMVYFMLQGFLVSFFALNKPERERELRGEDVKGRRTYWKGDC